MPCDCGKGCAVNLGMLIDEALLARSTPMREQAKESKKYYPWPEVVVDVSGHAYVRED